MKKFIIRAFSLVELMVTLIVISCLVAALAPVITKKLKSQGVTVIGGGDGSGGGEVSTDCSGLFNEDCKLCNINFCLQCEKACTDGFYKNIPRCNCVSCETYTPNCATCDSVGCLTCATDFKLENGLCKLSTVIKEFTTAGNHTFTVPQGVTELEVTLVSGGAGGGGGAAATKTETFVISGSANSANNADNLLHTSSNGLFTWTIPAAVRGKSVYVSACGGGGGGGTNSAGGRGGIIKNVSVPMPNQSTIGIIIGGGGGGAYKKGNCAYGGTGGVDWGSHTTTRTPACGATGTWGSGGVWHDGTGYGGYDPVFLEHGVGGGSGGSSGGGRGSRVGGGGGGVTVYYSGGGGGGATLFAENSLALVQAYVAPGGGGGAASGSSGSCGGGGGGGGGLGGGKGAVSSCHVSSVLTGPGGNGTGDEENIFGASYCAGGSAGSNGLNGAMRITYYDKPNGGTGGGAGQIVPNQKISVTPGDTLTVTVGAGAVGGAMNTSGQGANTTIVSKITNSGGAVLITTAANVSAVGATGGNPDGITVGAKGYITNGRNTAQITSAEYANTNGEKANGQIGGAGGKMTINGVELHCSPGGGGSLDNKGGDAIGYGGCGGGGGGAGAAGGAGAPGYVKIKYGA